MRIKPFDLTALIVLNVSARGNVKGDAARGRNETNLNLSNSITLVTISALVSVSKEATENEDAAVGYTRLCVSVGYAICIEFLKKKRKKI